MPDDAAYLFDGVSMQDVRVGLSGKGIEEMRKKNQYDNDAVCAFVHIEVREHADLDVVIPVEGSKKRDRDTNEI